MRRRLPLLFAALLMLAAVRPPLALASSNGNASRERIDSEISIDESSVPRIELPAAEIAVEAAADGNGAAAAVVEPEQLLAAVEAAAGGGAVRITVAATTEAENAVSVVMPGPALAAVVERTGAELEIAAGPGRMILSNEALAAILEQTDGGDVTFRMARGDTASGRVLLEQIGDDAADAARIRDGSVTEVDISSGGGSITSWDGGTAILELPAGPGCFEQNKGYRVIQISADKSAEEHTGRCVTDGEAPRVEISTTHLSTFLLLAGAVEEHAPACGPLVVSPLAVQLDGGSGRDGGVSGVPLAAAGLALLACASGGFVFMRRQRR